jgi:hypothetical protein
MVPEPDPSAQTQATERGAALALLPIAATLDYYVLPASLQEQALVQFAPQILAYLALGLWATHNRGLVSRLGLEKQKVQDGLRWGVFIGLVLGALNTVVILSIYPLLGYDISFLKTTPHARLPFWIMVPSFISGIALLVELNFRGFLLGRLLVMGETALGKRWPMLVSPLAVAITALTFSFDPFMMHTFRDLHWIAIWDGVIWGAFCVGLRNLYVPIVAHAVEVIVMYSVVRSALL